MKKLLRNLLILIPIVLWTIWPVILVAIAGSVASANGCELNETVINSCIVDGREMGNTLYSMGVMGWFMLVTIPTGVLALLIFLLLLLIEWLVGRARAKRRLAAQSAAQPIVPPPTVPDTDASA
ncbi:MAG TPA: hypothetical protein VL334_02170 [Anaerolineae bacterium]|nr:hypothetical protein [Anaerolineae bacterium]